MSLLKKDLEVINGGLLGDGSLAKGEQGNAWFSYASSENSHSNYILRFLKNILQIYIKMERKNMNILIKGQIKNIQDII